MSVLTIDRNVRAKVPALNKPYGQYNQVFLGSAGGHSMQLFSNESRRARAPRYRDDEYAKAAGHPSVIAPPTLVCETCQYADTGPGENGYIGHEWDLPVDGVRLIRSGNSYEFVRPVLPEDQISVTWTIEDIEERPA